MDSLGVENGARKTGKALGNDICDLATKIRREDLVCGAQIVTLQEKRKEEKKRAGEFYLLGGENCFIKGGNR